MEKEVMQKETMNIGGVEYRVVEPLPGTYWDKKPRVLEGPDGVQRLEKLPSDRLQVRINIEISGAIRRADLDRFAQTLSKSVAFEFEDGGGGP